MVYRGMTRIPREQLLQSDPRRHAGARIESRDEVDVDRLVVEGLGVRIDDSLSAPLCLITASAGWPCSS
jgi:hypothetical protein